MDMVRGAIINALIEDMSLEDLWFCAEHAETPDAFDDAVNLLTYTLPEMTELNDAQLSAIFSPERRE